jgi:hypothetical protein
VSPIANEHTFVVVVSTHADPVRQNRSTAERTGGINSDNPDGLALLAKRLRQFVHQRTLAAAW